jgi:hypothetical protein
MINALLIIFAVLVNTCVVFAQNNTGTGIIREATSYYYLKDGTQVNDSMFITLTYYNKAGARQKEEETHYMKGKKQRSFAALYNANDQLIEMRENGVVSMKNEFDSNGTIIKSVGFTNDSKVTFEVIYAPTYANGKLIERRVIQKAPYGSIESIERYTYTQTEGMACTISKSDDSQISRTEIKCYNRNKKLVSISNKLKTPGGREQSSSIANKYDNAGNLLEITELMNDEQVASEKFTYVKDKLESSILQKGDILIKTDYKFIE